MAAASRVMRSPVGFSAFTLQPRRRTFQKDIPVTVAAPQYLQQTQSSCWGTQVLVQTSPLAGRHTRAATAARPDPHGSSNTKPEADATQEAAQQADILVNIEPDQAATLFRSSDGLTHQEVIEQLKEEYGRGVLKAGLITLPPTSALLPPGLYTFKRSASQGPSSSPPSPVSSIGAAMEGINPKKRLGAYTRRTITCVRILAFLVVAGALLIRAPPESGKTSTLQLLGDHVSQGLSPDFDRVYYVSLGTVGKIVDGREITFDEVWSAGNKGVDFRDLWKSYNETEAVGKRTLLLVDEGQAAFDQPLALFSYIKFAQSSKREMRTKVIMVSSWGSNQVRTQGQWAETPGSWSDANTITLWPNPKSELPSLQFTLPEAEELWDGWLRVNNWQGYNSSSIKDWILRTTERQPGTLSRVLGGITMIGLGTGRKTEPEWRATITEFLLSPDFFKSLDSLRSLESMRKTLLKRNYSTKREAARYLARKLLEDIDMQVAREVLTYEEEDAADDMARMGQLIETPTHYSLPSQLHYQYLARTIYSGRPGVAGDVLDQGIDHFVDAVIERFNPKHLREATSRRWRDALVYERLLQNMFYRCALSCLPLDTVLSVDVGPLFGASGFLDYQLSTPFFWGFELLRGGDKRAEHLERFGPTGKYGTLVQQGVVRDWSVIDFSLSPIRDEDLVDKFTHVFFYENYRKALIRRKGKVDVLVTLREPT